MWIAQNINKTQQSFLYVFIKQKCQQKGIYAWSYIPIFEQEIVKKRLHYNKRILAIKIN